MSLLIRIIISSILSLLLLSCNFDSRLALGKKGNGHVTTEERHSHTPFSQIEASHGLQVNLTPAKQTKVTVVADENLQDLILTDIKDGVLYLYCKSKIGNAASKTVNVSFNVLTQIETKSGARVKASHPITAKQFIVKASSGSHTQLNIDSETLYSHAANGSMLHLRGSARNFTANASSGSALNAKNLHTAYAEVSASSGANLKVTTTETLLAKATSGANITYAGEPKTTSVEKSSGGHVKPY
jgi:hypothetical protein